MSETLARVARAGQLDMFLLCCPQLDSLVEIPQMKFVAFKFAWVHPDQSAAGNPCGTHLEDLRVSILC